MALKLGIPELVACAVLAELHSRREVEADELYPPAFARTLWADVKLARFDGRRTNLSRSEALAR